MMVNPDGYTKTLDHQKILGKTQKNNVLKTKAEIKAKWRPGLYLPCWGGDSLLLIPDSYASVHHKA